MLDRIVEVFCEVDDFCKAFVPHWEASLLGTGGPAPRGPQPGLSPSEIITLLLVLHSSGFKHLKNRGHYRLPDQPVQAQAQPSAPLSSPNHSLKTPYPGYVKRHGLAQPFQADFERLSGYAQGSICSVRSSRSCRGNA